MSEKKTVRVPSVPLITCDPYFSLWSPADHLYDADTQHWSDQVKRMHGVVKVDGIVYRFLGGEDGYPTPMQTGLSITATTSTYRFEVGGISFSVRFWTPLLLEDLELVSRPCSYLDISAESLDKSPHSVSFQIKVDEGFCYHGDTQKPMISDVLQARGYTAAWMAQRSQRPLGHSGDGITIDWGTMYFAVPNDGPATVSSEMEDGRLQLIAKTDFGVITDQVSSPLLFAYDDTLSIFYFSHAVKGLWARGDRTIFDAIADAFSQREHLRNRCDALDLEISQQARKVAGEEYDLICSLAYRQTIAAHKLIEDEDGKVVFLSKECYSNGCIGTVDVSYPSVPLYLLYQPELVFGMLRPVFRFSRAPVWTAGFAPHDVGRYPYATGQVYALKPFDGSIQLGHGARMPDGEVYPHYYAFPMGVDLYDPTHQMPVEECGNMLIMTAAASLYANDFTLAEENLDLLEKWCKYLIRYGADPGDQLCTDDFAGHLAHNINLAAKAIVGIAAYAIILDGLSKPEESSTYMTRARKMAADWERRADAGDHTALTFHDGYGWSLKYNTIWDRIFGTGLFSDPFYEREIVWYLSHQNPFGVPLDIRNDYTKTDWIAWVAAFASNREDAAALLHPIANFLRKTGNRVPFSDFYETSTARHRKMQNRTVQGGLFMPILATKPPLQ